MYDHNVSAINDNSINTIYSKTFSWMFIGLIITAALSWGMYSSGLAIQYASSFSTIGIINLGVALVFGFLNNKLSTASCSLLFLIYSALNGVTLSVIYYLFELDSIIMILFAAAGLFGAFAYLGHSTKMDLSNLGSLCMGVLLVGIILSLINLFMQNSMLDIVLSWVLLIVFFGITAYDMQKIKELIANNPDNNKIHINAAFDLYLDFINIFIRLLFIFGKARD